MMQVAQAGIRPDPVSGDVTGVFWCTKIEKYPTDPYPLHDFRCDFVFAEWRGGGALTFGIQNVRHVFEDGQRFSGQVPVEVGKLGLYASDQSAAFGESSDLVMRCETEYPPRFGHCYEVVDGIGWVGRQVYSRGQIDQPATVSWMLRRKKRRRYAIAGLWPWDLHMSVSSPSFETRWTHIATFYVNRKYLSSKPLTILPEYFARNPLSEQPTEVCYSHMSAFVDNRWSRLENWTVEVQNKADDKNVGWESSEDGLVLHCGKPGLQSLGDRLVLR